jgi:hypothetical protein
MHFEWWWCKLVKIAWASQTAWMSFLVSMEDFNDYGLQHLMFTVVKFANSGEMWRTSIVRISCGIRLVADHFHRRCFAERPTPRPDWMLEVSWDILRYFEIQRTSWDVAQVVVQVVQRCRISVPGGSGHPRPHSGCWKVLPGRWWGRGQFCPHGVRLAVLVLGLSNVHSYQMLLNLRSEIIEI